MNLFKEVSLLRFILEHSDNMYNRSEIEHFS